MITTSVRIGEQDRDFPKMMMGADGQVVLFSDHGEGVAITKGDGDPIGEYSECWNMDLFSDFMGSVTITNEG